MLEYTVAISQHDSIIHFQTLYIFNHLNLVLRFFLVDFFLICKSYIVSIYGMTVGQNEEPISGTGRNKRYVLNTIDRATTVAVSAQVAVIG